MVVFIATGCFFGFLSSKIIKNIKVLTVFFLNKILKAINKKKFIVLLDKLKLVSFKSSTYSNPGIFISYGLEKNNNSIVEFVKIKHEFGNKKHGNNFIKF